MDMNAKNAMLCWNPGTAEVVVILWPDQKQVSRSFRMTGLAAYADIHNLDFEGRKVRVFIEAMHLIIRDKVEPQAVHKALLDLDEYLDGCSDDMPGVWEKRKAQ